MPSAVIRDELAVDVSAIAKITREAFAAHSNGSPTEHLIIEALRRAGALSVSLVAELDGRVVGHIAFSPVTISDGSSGWYGLGPVSVTAAFQCQGIGQRLVQRGIERLRDAGAQGCVLVGEPAFYGRFGFVHNPSLFLAGVSPAYFLSLPFGSNSANGEITYHGAFSVEA
jgi:predicted N-acetyltransferase YhbS